MEITGFRNSYLPLAIKKDAKPAASVKIATNLGNEELNENKNVNKAIEQAKPNNPILAQFVNSPKKVDEHKKAHAKARFQELAKQVMQLKKMLSGDPKALAKALAVIARELKAIVKEYGAALNGGAIDTNAPPTPASQDAKPSEAQAPKTMEGEAAEIVSKADDEAPQTAVKTETAQTDEATEKPPIQDPIKAYAQGLFVDEDTQFMRGVKNMVSEIKHYMGLAKAKIKFAKMGEEGEKLIKDNEESFKDLIKEVEDFEGDLGATKQNVGQMVSIAA